MALVLKDRVRETTTTTGTGTITLTGGVFGYQSFSSIGSGNTTYYCIAGQSTSEWEVGIGTYTLIGTTLSRDTILASSNSGSVVNFSAGTKDVFVVYPAGKSVNQDASGNVGIGTASPTAKLDVNGNVSVTGTLSATGGITGASPFIVTGTNLGAGSSIWFGSDTLGGGAINVPTGKVFLGLVNQAEVIRYSSTGLAVTGAISATSTISTTSGFDAVNVGTSTGLSTRVNALFRGTDAGGTARVSYVGTNIYGTDGSLEFGTNVAGLIMTLNNSGNVGIGTASPNTALTLGTTNPVLSFYQPDSTYSLSRSGTTMILNSAGSTTVTSGSASIMEVRNGFIQFKTGAGAGTTERMRIDSSGIVLIGTASATGSNLLQVNSDALVNTLTVGRGPGNKQDNAVLGYQALNNGGANVGSSVAIGYQALFTATAVNADRQVAIGYQALYSNNDSTGAVNIGIGYLAGKAATGKSNLFIGGYCSYLRTTGDYNTFVGGSSGTNFSSVPTGNSNTALGASSLGSLTTGYANVSIGYATGALLATGACNVFVGEVAGYNATGSRNVFVGGGNTIGSYSAGQLQTSGDANTYIGSSAGGLMTTGNYNVIIGGYTGNSGGLDMRALNNYIVLADGQANIRQVIDSSGNVGIGTASPGAKLQLNTGTTTTVGQIIQMVASQTADVLRVTRSDANLSFQFTPSGQLSIGDIAASATTVITTGPSTSTNANLKVSAVNVGNPNIFIQSAQGGGGSIAGPTSFVYFGDNNRALSYIGGTKVNAFAANASSDLVFGTTPDISATAVTERMRIDSSGNVGIGATANASAILDAQSTTKGVRMPNMTTTQKNAIASPAAGLMVFDTTLAKLCVYSGTAWQTITSV